MSGQEIAEQVTIQQLTAKLRELPNKAFSTTERITELLRSLPVKPESLEPYLTWDRQHYTRNLIDKTPIYELIAICWEVGQVSSVHNHLDQNCWMAAPIGRLLVQNYRTLSEDLSVGKCKLESIDIVEMNALRPCAVDPAEPVHRVLNPRKFNQRAVSLHVYSRPFDSCVVYSPELGTCGKIKLQYTTEFGEPKTGV